MYPTVVVLVKAEVVIAVVDVPMSLIRVQAPVVVSAASRSAMGAVQ
jgi:hypothetical protein